MTHKVGSGLVTGGECLAVSSSFHPSVRGDEIIIVRLEDGVRERGMRRRQQQLGVFRTGRDLGLGD